MPTLYITVLEITAVIGSYSLGLTCHLLVIHTHSSMSSMWLLQSGDTPLQYYNTLLSLPYLQEYSDCVLLFQNDTLLTEALKTSNTVTMATLYYQQYIVELYETFVM